MRRYSPPCMTARRGGCVNKKNSAKPPKPTQPGWFSFCSHRDTTPASRTADASRYFLDHSATPPRGDARRGFSLDSNSCRPSMTPTVGMSTLLPRRPQPDVLVTGLVGNVGDDQLKHFISDA